MKTFKRVVRSAKAWCDHKGYTKGKRKEMMYFYIKSLTNF